MKKDTYLNEEEVEVRIIHDFNVEIREDAEGNPVISGYAAVFNKPSEEFFPKFREMIAPGAFDGRLNDDVRATIDHEGGLNVLGRTKSNTLKLSIDDTGLKYELTPPETNAGRDIVEIVKRGDIDQSSFAFRMAAGGDEYSEDDDGNVTRTIKKISKLFDVSPVTYPAYPDTTVAVRSLEMFRNSNETSQVVTNRNLYESKQALMEAEVL